MRKVITAEQLRAIRGRGELRLEAGAILTPSAQDVAREMGISVIVDGECPSSDPVDSPIRSVEAARGPEPRDTIIIAAFGQDRLGILAALSSAIAEAGGNIRDVSQTIMRGYFSLILSVQLDPSMTSFKDFKERTKSLGQSLGLEVSVQKQVIFQAMHRI